MAIWNNLSPSQTSMICVINPSRLQISLPRLPPGVSRLLAEVNQNPVKARLFRLTYLTCSAQNLRWDARFLPMMTEQEHHRLSSSATHCGKDDLAVTVL